MTEIERFAAAVAGAPTDRLPCHPLTMTFASRLIGRPYRDYIMDHRVMAAGQLAVVERFGVDFVSTISDPCRETHDLGGRPVYFDDEAPANDPRDVLLRDKADLVRLTRPDLLGGGRMHDRIQGVALLRERLGRDFPVQGWVEGPIALAVDLRGMEPLMLDTLDDPDFVADLFAFCVDLEIEFARLQVQAGADHIGVGDAAASLVGPRLYRELVYGQEKRLIDAIHGMGVGVRLHVCGNVTDLVADFASLGCELVDIDFLCDFAHARANMPATALLGNLEPATWLLRGTPDQVYTQVAECHAIAGQRFVVGAGCEVPRDTPHDNFRALCRYAAEHRNTEHEA